MRTSRPMSRRVLLALAAALSLVATGCSEDDASTDTSGGDVTDVSVTADTADDASTDAVTPDIPSADVPVDAGPLPEGTFADLPTDAAFTVPGLSGAVSVVTDERGLPHIYADTLENLMTALGYVHARDRYPMMELFKRVARGRLGELLGGADAGIVRDDIVNRTLGFSRVGEEMYAALEPGSQTKRAVDAYALGVNAYVAELRAGTRRLAAPFDIFMPVTTIEDWVPSDSFALGRVQAHSLSFDSDHEIGLTAWAQAIKAAFPADSDDPAIAARAGYLQDVYRWAPVDPAIQYPDWVAPDSYVIKPDVGTGDDTKAAALPGGGPARAVNPRAKLGLTRPQVDATLLERGARFISGTSLVTELNQRGASNNWAVGPSLTASGHAIVCNDPHLSLDNPPLFYFAHLNLAASSPDGPITAIGGNFPGIPGFLIGHTDKVAWTLTTAADDRTDAYLEKLTVNGETATTTSNGSELPVEITIEEIKVGTAGIIARTIDVPVFITAQGRVLVPELTEDGVAPFETGDQLSYAWAGFGPTEELDSLVTALSAADATELREGFHKFSVANQNILGGDVDGNIFGLSPGGLPLREDGAMTWDPDTNPEGTAPWWVLPGDGGADWAGTVPGSDGPQVVNPAAGFVKTANEDHTGQTLDNHPLNDGYYVGYEYSLGFRAGRIGRLLDGTGEGSPAAGGAKVGLDEMLRVQGDVRSGLGELLRDEVLSDVALFLAEVDTPGTHPDLAPLAVDFADELDAFRSAAERLEAWSLETPTGLSENGETPTDDDKADAVATTLFNMWLVNANKGLLADENAMIGRGAGTSFTIRALAHAMLAAPEDIATYDAELGGSVLWDDMATEGVRETRTFIVVRALLQAVRDAPSLFADGTPMAEWYWGELHRLNLDSLLPVPGGSLDLPPPGDDRFGKGYSRPGGQYAVNVCNPGSSDYKFGCGSGPILRMCVELDPAGPRAYHMMPGGQVMDRTSPHYADWIDDWMAHKPYYWAFTEAEVRAKAENHMVLTADE